MVPYSLAQAVIFGQMFLWIHLWYRDVHLPERYASLIYVAGVGGVALIQRLNWTVGYYTPLLQAQYVVLVMGAFWVYGQRWPLKENLCLSFLTVFLNSLYWELPIHLMEFAKVGPQTYMLPQLFRGIPALFLLAWFRPRQGAWRLLLLGVVFSSAVMFLNWIVFKTFLIRNVLFFVNRAGCLYLLVKTIYEGEARDG